MQSCICIIYFDLLGCCEMCADEIETFYSVNKSSISCSVIYIYFVEMPLCGLAYLSLIVTMFINVIRILVYSVK